MNKISVHIFFTHTQTPLSRLCYSHDKGKYYKRVEVRTAEDFVARAYAIDRGLIKENQIVQNG